MPGGTWVPILTDHETSEAGRSILQIAQDLGGEEWSPDRLSPSLSGGNAGIAIFYDELSRLDPRAEFQLRRDQHWNAAVDGLARYDVPPALYGGFTGIGWANHLLGSGGTGVDRQLPEDEAHEELDEVLLECLSNVRTPANYDLISGPVGWGLYALARWPHPRAVRALELIVDFLESAAEHVPEGVRWWSSPTNLPEWQRERAPDGYYNLGLSHGIPGICVVLAQALARGIRASASASLLEGAVSWVLAQQIVGQVGLSFPPWVTRGKAPSPSRLGWCYGDLGVASALRAVAQVSGNESWRAMARSIARRAAAVPKEESGVLDAGLCHGTSGIAHLFNRFYQESHEAQFQAAARAWTQVTLNMRRDGIGPGGYAAWRTEPTPGWRPSPGLLEGSAGIGLALLAATGSREPEWDRFLFVSSVPVPAERKEAVDPQGINNLAV
jgi:lantibiotic modifying enzyme